MVRESRGRLGRVENFAGPKLEKQQRKEPVLRLRRPLLELAWGQLGPLLTHVAGR